MVRGRKEADERQLTCASGAGWLERPTERLTMRRRTILTTAAVIAVGALVIPTAANAANGGSWLLGRTNYESAATTVSNSAGTPLSLKAKAGYAPLAVNSTKTVTNLSSLLPLPQRLLGECPRPCPLI